MYKATNVKFVPYDILLKKISMKSQKKLITDLSSFNVEAAERNNRLLYLCSRRFFSKAMKLVEEYKDIDVNVSDKDNNRPLSYAAAENQYELVHLLLQRGAYVDAQDKCAGWAALHFAANVIHVDIVKMLLANKADIRLSTKYYRWGIEPNATALDIAQLRSRSTFTISALLNPGYVEQLLAICNIRLVIYAAAYPIFLTIPYLNSYHRK